MNNDIKIKVNFIFILSAKRIVDQNKIIQFNLKIIIRYLLGIY